MEEKVLSPIKAIRKYCLECCLGSANEVKLCACKSCSLFPYRMGHSPNRKGRVMTEEEKAIAAERLRKAREAKALENQS